MSAASTDGSGTEVALANMTKGGVKVDINEVIERRWEERAKQQEEVRRRMRTGWKTDPSMLDEYFKSVVTNWKSYRGPKTEKIVCKMYGIYKQAVVGDCTTSNTHDLLSLPSKKWEQWNCRKGMSKEDSKRRFITFCAEIDPMLIDIMPNEMPPDGFPCDNKGIPICAKCNTVVGCSRPLLDEHFQNLRRQLFEQPELQKPNNLRSWMANALKNQRCMWGVHKPVNLVDAKKFSEWFNRTENRGYHMYDSKNLMLMVRDLLCLLYEILVDMQKNKDVHTIEEVNAQIMKVYALDKYYFEFTGDKYVYETECTRDEEICNKRREGDGGRNHKHPVEIEPPEVDYSPFDEAIALRKKCQELGINPATGIQIDVEKRCERYREKIKEYEMAQEAIVAARKRNEMRSAQLPISKVKIKNISADLLIKHMVNACNENDKLKILSLGERGCTCNVETPRGMRPLTVIQIQSPTNAEFAKLLACRGADVNSVNKYGMSALMLACRMKDTKTILYYCDTAGADEAVSGGIRGKGRTALHYCAIHSSEEAAKIIYDQVEKANDVMRSIKFIDAQDANGDTALITAAKHGNGIMCRALLNMGANPILQNKEKRTAALEARENRFLYLADWLSKKISSGVSGVETFSDVQFEKTIRFQTMQVLSMIADFSRATLNVLLGRPSGSIFGTPSQTKQYIQINGEYGRKEQNRLVNSYMKFVLNKQNIEIPDSVAPFLEEMRQNMTSMMEILRQGEAYPGAEMNEKPMPWTALFCACVMNDMRSIRQLKQWGADPNYQNRHGTTALMISAQLHNVDAIVELLLAGADPAVLDNEGFSALAYASSFPLPHDLQRSTVHVLFDGEQGSGSKAFRADEVLKLALAHTPAEVKAKVEANKVIVAKEVVTKVKPQLKLWEKQGLSTVDTMEDLEIALKRVHQEDSAMNNFNDELESLREKNIGRGPASIKSLLNFGTAESNHDGSVTTVSLLSNDSGGEIQNFDLSDLMNDEKPEENEAVEGPVRCPICTLKIPCSHFYNQAALDDYIEKRKSGKRNYSDGSALGYEKNIKKREAEIHRNRIMNNVFNREGMKVLREAELDNRKTNRSDRYLPYMKEHGVDKPKGDNIDESSVPVMTDVIPLNPYAGAEVTQRDDVPESVLSLSAPDAADKSRKESTAHVDPPVIVANSTDVTIKTLPDDCATTDSVVSNITEPSLSPSEVQIGEPAVINTSAVAISIENESGNDQVINEFVGHQYEMEKETAEVFHDGNISGTLAGDHKKDNDITDSGRGPNSTSKIEVMSSEVEVDSDKVNLDDDVHEYYKFTTPLPSLKDSPARSVLMKTHKSARKRVLAEKSTVKKFHSNRRVIKFKINDDILDGGIGAKDVKVSDVSVSSFEESVNSEYISRVDLVLDDEDEIEISSSRELDICNPSLDDQKDGTDKDLIDARQAVHLMLTGSKNDDEEQEKSLKLFGENPVAVSRRTVSMFTQRYKDAVLLDTKTSLNDKDAVIADSGLASNEGKTGTSVESEGKLNGKFLAVKNDHRIYFSGWLFSGLFSLDVAKKPIDTVCIDPDIWRNCLVQLNESFAKEWLPNLLRMECLVDIETWKVSTKQCSTCMIGFIRYREGSEISEGDKLIKDVCLACFTRKRLYDSVVKSIPRSARKMFLHEWPFHVKDDGVEKFSDNDRKAMIMKFLRGYTGAAAVASVADDIDPSTIMEGKIVMDTREMSDVAEEVPPDPEKVQKEVIANYYKTSKSQDAAKNFMTMVKTDKIAPIVIAEENKANLFEKKKRVYAGARKILSDKEANVKSISLTENYSQRERAKIQPSEIPLLHVLLSNRNFEEVERVCRICVALEEYGGEDGVMYVVTLGMLQAEMYKMLGLWVLALAVYVDATDLLVTRLGFDDRLCISAFCNIDMIFRRLEMPAAGKLYISSLVARIKKHTFSDNTRKNESIDAILARYSHVLRRDQILVSFKADMEKVYTHDRELWRIGNQVYGIGSLIKLMSSTSPQAIVAKEYFIDFCEAKMCYKDDENNGSYFSFVKFCDECLKLWDCTVEELYRLLAQRLIKRYLSVRSAAENMPVAEVYENISTEADHEKVILFLKEGNLVQPEVFNPILEYCLSVLLKPYRAFIGTKMGESVRLYMLGDDANAEFMHVVVVLIQNRWRRHRAQKRVKAMLAGRSNN